MSPEPGSDAAGATPLRRDWFELVRRTVKAGLARLGILARRMSFDEMPFGSVYVVERPEEARA